MAYFSFGRMIERKEKMLFTDFQAHITSGEAVSRPDGTDQNCLWVVKFRSWCASGVKSPVTVIQLTAPPTSNIPSYEWQLEMRIAYKLHSGKILRFTRSCEAQSSKTT